MISRKCRLQNNKKTEIYSVALKVLSIKLSNKIKNFLYTLLQNISKNQLKVQFLHTDFCVVMRVKFMQFFVIVGPSNIFANGFVFQVRWQNINRMKRLGKLNPIHYEKFPIQDSGWYIGTAIKYFYFKYVLVICDPKNSPQYRHSPEAYIRFSNFDQLFRVWDH